MQLFMTIPWVLGVDVMGRAVGVTGLLQTLQLDKARHGQGVPLREGGGEIFCIAEAPRAV